MSQVPIRKPLFIIGLPRTGTTFLNWLLSCDKQFSVLNHEEIIELCIIRSPAFWELMEPCPPGIVEDYTKDSRYQRAAMAIEFRKASMSSRTYAGHATEANKPEECIILLLRSFYQGFLRFPLHSMDDYCKLIDNFGSCETMKHVYRYYKKNLQALAYKHDMENRGFLLKAPNHLLHIEALLDVFPDAQLVFTHRRISQIVPSFLSLNLSLIQQYGGVPDIKWKKRILGSLRSWLVCGLKSVEKLSHSSSRNPVYNLSYPDLILDPLGEMRKLYDYFGMTFTPQIESAMQHYLDNDPKKTIYGAHKYTLEEFGLTTEDLKEEFKEYIEIMSKRTKMEDIL